MNSKPSILTFHCYESLAQLPDNASALFAHAEKVSLFYSHEWFDNLLQYREQGERDVRLACVLSGTEVVAMLPLVASANGSLRALTHPYASHYSVLRSPDADEAVMNCLMRGVMMLPSRGFLLEPVSFDDGAVVQLQRSAQKLGCECSSAFRFYNWVLHLPEGQSYEEYLATRPSRLRNTIKRKWRKLAREQQHEIHLFTNEQVPSAMDDYHTVFQSSWKAHEQYPEFLHGLVERFSRQGWSRLGVLTINSKPAAAQLWFTLHRKANIFRLAHDEAWRQYSPGTLLTSHLMEHAIEKDKVLEIDFLTGNEAYKQDWMTQRRERVVLSCVKKVGGKRRFGWFFQR